MAWVPQGIDGVFFITVLTIITGSFGLAVRYCLKSKCESFNLCFGLLKIQRRVDLELQEEIVRMELGESKTKNRNENKKDLENNSDI